MSGGAGSVRTVALIGPMGAGKSSIGRRLAKALSRPFIDTDTVIAQQHGPIPEIFAQHGEEVFRRWEAEAVAQALDTPGAVVALGGGSVLDAGTRERLASADVVLLMSTAEAVLARIKTGGRPLLAEDPGAWQRILDERRPLYESLATITVDTAGRPKDEVAAQLKEWVEERA